MKIERNDPCPCGSGKKIKHCHLREIESWGSYENFIDWKKHDEKITEEFNQKFSDDYDSEIGRDKNKAAYATLDRLNEAEEIFEEAERYTAESIAKGVLPFLGDQYAQLTKLREDFGKLSDSIDEILRTRGVISDADGIDNVQQDAAGDP